MKTFFLSCLCVIIFTNLFLGCKKNTEQTKLKNPTELSEDEQFVKLTIETYDYLLFISHTIKKNNLTLVELQTQLSAIRNTQMSYSDQLSSIDKAFQSRVSDKIEMHIKTYNSIWISLKSQYQNITQEVFANECAEVIKKHNEKHVNRNNDLSAMLAADDCGWRYYLCSGAATAGAILCHAGCDTTALATTAGLGIPVCVAACGTLQAYAIVQCADSYCK